MSTVLVDSNIIMDVIASDSEETRWSVNTLERLSNHSPLVINPLIYAEVSVAFASIEALETALPLDLYKRDGLPYEAGFLAGKAFLEYRRRGGLRKSPLPDFYIGAHAAVADYRLLTRDVARYRTYFPTVGLIAPTS